MKALAEQIVDIDRVEIYGRVVPVRGLDVGSGHIVMERAIAERGRYPAINILKSISRTMPRAADPAHLPAINRARQVMGYYSDMEELQPRRGRSDRLAQAFGGLSGPV